MRIELISFVYETNIISHYTMMAIEPTTRIELVFDVYKTTVINRYTMSARANMSKMPHLNYVL